MIWMYHGLFNQLSINDIYPHSLFLVQSINTLCEYFSEKWQFWKFCTTEIIHLNSCQPFKDYDWVAEIKNLFITSFRNSRDAVTL